jgi:hypothetical protein
MSEMLEEDFPAEALLEVMMKKYLSRRLWAAAGGW